MNKAEKIELIRSIMDELATIGYLDTNRSKHTAIDVVKDYLQGFIIPVNPSKADLYINDAKVIVCAPTGVFADILQLANGFLELALTELHK